MNRKVVHGVELSDGQEQIETVSSSVDYGKLASEEAFMNESVTIEIHTTTDENQPPQVVVNVNGVNTVFFRGVPTVTKRKFVEVLARMKETKYTERVTNPMDPSSIEHIPRTVMVYPFSVLEDRNPKGRAWLNHVMAEPA